MNELTVMIMVYIIGIIISGLVFDSIISRKLSKKNNHIPMYRLSYEDIMTVLTTTIENEFRFKYKLYYEIRDTRIINDFRADVKELVDRVILSLGDDFLKEAGYFYRRKALISLVTRQVELMLTKFIDDKKIKTM